MLEKGEELAYKLMVEGLQLHAIKTIIPIKKDGFYYYEKKSKTEWKLVRKFESMDSSNPEELVFDIG